MSKGNRFGTVKNNITIGLPSSEYKYVYFNNENSNKPGIRYNSSKMQYSHDGITWNDIGSGGDDGYNITVYPTITNLVTKSNGFYEEFGYTWIDPRLHDGQEFVYEAAIYTSGEFFFGDVGNVDLYNKNESAQVAEITFPLAVLITSPYIVRTQLIPGSSNFSTDGALYSTRLQLLAEGVGFIECYSARILVGNEGLYDYLNPPEPI
jgi:hypothetical protein